jgi:hypothetical protein
LRVQKGRERRKDLAEAVADGVGLTHVELRRLEALVTRALHDPEFADQFAEVEAPPSISSRCLSAKALY